MKQPDSPAQPATDPPASPEAGSTEAPDVPFATPLCAALSLPQHETTMHCGALTARVIESLPDEIHALLHGAGISDLGWRGKIRMTGSDRVRWLNGMVSNTVQALGEGQGNYSFLLSAQGRIQGDCWIYRRDADLLLDTGRDQLSRVLTHLDHFVIMDDVELADVSSQWTALSLAGPRAAQVLQALGISLPADRLENARFTAALVGEVSCILVEVPSALIPRFELWFAPEHVIAVWETLQAAGAEPCGLAAAEAVRVLEATPLYGVDLNDRDLPQETAQTRALNFSKGCYLGQEIVERIRSRGKVNRQFRQFLLQGSTPLALPFDLVSGEQPVGRITSMAALPGTGLLALGVIRVEVAERHADITYPGGVAKVLAEPPAVVRPT